MCVWCTYTHACYLCQACLLCVFLSRTVPYQMDGPRSNIVQPLHYQVWRVVLWHLDLRDCHLRQIPLPGHEQSTGSGGSPNGLPHAVPSQLPGEAVRHCPWVLEGRPWPKAYLWNSRVDAGGVLLRRNSWRGLSWPGWHANKPLVTRETYIISENMNSWAMALVARLLLSMPYYSSHMSFETFLFTYPACKLN